MELFREDTKVADAIFRYPNLLTILDRFGIYMGVGDFSFKEICEQKGYDAGFILIIINTYVNEDYFPEEVVTSFPLSEIIEYLTKTDLYYKEVLLKNIDRHFFHLINNSGGEDNNLHLLRKLSEEMRDRIYSRIEWDKFSFPRMLGGDEQEKYNVQEIIEKDIAIEDTISDLISFFVIHLKGEYNRNLCLAVVSALFTLEKDVRQNNRIRHRILLPSIIS